MADTDVLPKRRINSIDILRGIVMVVMALDHTRDFFSNVQYDPTDLSKASTALFLTRFITHYCAPCFVFLAGTGAYMSLHRGKTTAQASRFLLTRGLWLILLELTVIRFGWILNFNYSFIVLQVFWALGCSMVVLAALVYLPVPVITGFGLILIFGHNAFDGLTSKEFTPAMGVLWQFLHVSSMVNYGNHYQIFAFYPLIPWVGVMACGYGFGALYRYDYKRRRNWLLLLGCGAILLFVALRYNNVYGDPNHWETQPVWYRSILSFINVQKYPPSLDYLLITLGPAMLALAALEHASGVVANVFLVYGRVPMFYYILHLYLLRLSSACITVASHLLHFGYGWGLPVVYMVWLLAVFILFFPTRWYMRYKSTHRQWWLSYL